MRRRWSADELGERWTLGPEDLALLADLRLIQDYLGHRDPKHTVRYTRVAGSRFEGLWR
jgi:hypothetical protein